MKVIVVPNTARLSITRDSNKPEEVEVVGLRAGAVLDNCSVGLPLLEDGAVSYAMATAHASIGGPGDVIFRQSLYLVGIGGDYFATPVLENQPENAITPLGVQGPYLAYAVTSHDNITTISVAAFVDGVLRPLGEVYRGQLPVLQPMGIQPDGRHSAVITDTKGNAVITLSFHGDGTVQAVPCIPSVAAA